MPHPPPSLRFAEHPPDDSLSPWIWSYWEFEVAPGAPPVHHVPPDGCTSIVIPIFPGAPSTPVVSGPWLEPLPLPVAPGSRYVGVRFACGAAASFLGVRAASLVNRITSGETVLGTSAGELASQVAATSDLAGAATAIDGVLRRFGENPAPPDPLVRAAVLAISAGCGTRPIGLLAKELGTSERTLLRRFREAAGFTPKQFARIQRLRNAAMAMIGQRAPLSRLAVEGGYADQPHLTHEFVALLGLTPAEMQEIVRATRHQLLPE